MVVYGLCADCSSPPASSETNPRTDVVSGITGYPKVIPVLCPAVERYVDISGQVAWSRSDTTISPST
jgi:hypothetical protein